MALGADALALFEDFVTVLASGIEFADYLLADSGTPEASHFTVPAQGQGNPARLPERGMLVLLAIGLLWIAAGRRKTR